MNASRPLFPASLTAASALAAVGACALLSGCVGNPFSRAKIDPSSPVAPEVAKLTHQPAKFPTFASIPNPPKDVRPLAQYGKSAAAIDQAGERLAAATAPSTWTLSDSEAFAETARKEAGPQLEPPTPGDAEAFAKEQRARATPPPPR